MRPERHIIITGANSGIGLALARALASQGDRVACFDIAGDQLAGLHTIHCDVTDPTDVERSVEAVLSEWGKIDILVNNACLALFAPFEDKTLEATRREFEVNYFGYLNMIRAVLPAMKAQHGGVIHNVSSTVGLTGFAGIYGYASTKGAIEAMSRSLAIELSPYGVAVNIIHPPLTRTRSSAPLGIPGQLMADPSEVGRKLARKIGSTKPVLTAGLPDALGVGISRVAPGFLGRFLSARAAEARERAPA